MTAQTHNSNNYDLKRILEGGDFDNPFRIPENDLEAIQYQTEDKDKSKHFESILNWKVETMRYF